MRNKNSFLLFFDTSFNVKSMYIIRKTISKYFVILKREYFWEKERRFKENCFLICKDR